MYLQNSENQRKVRQVMLGLVLLLFGSFSYGQHITVSGMVSDANGPLPGASIIVQGTSNGTTTDFDGKYSLGDVPSDAVLEISYIGYKKVRVPVDGRATVNATLEEDLAQLDEVVVVGYGTQSRRVVTGAIESIDSEAMASIPVTTSEQALQGRTSGCL